MDLTAVQVKQFNADVTKTIEKFVQVSVKQRLPSILCDKKYALMMFTVFMIP